jgi:DNA (cytosine-5)-methyltransferase 1
VSQRKRALDLFCGAGGASIGLKAAGYEVLGVDKWPDAVKTHNHNGMPAMEADLSAIGPDEWALWQGMFDLVWGSPPCQPFSQGGRNAGRYDERDGFPWFLAAIDGLRPRVFVMENVRGLTFKKHRPYLDQIQGELEALGYRVEWRLINCADYGVPQKRQRLFMIGRSDGEAPVWPIPTHSKDGAQLGTVPWVTMAEALGWGHGDAPARTICGNRNPRWIYDDPDGNHGRVITARERAIHGPDDEKADWVYEHPACTVVGSFRPDRMAPPEYRTDPSIPRQKAAGTVTIEREEAAALQGFPVALNTGRDWKKGEDRSTAQTVPVTEPAPTISGVPSQARWEYEEPAPTVSGTFGGVGGKKKGGHRNLTIPEAAILQAFPDGFEFLGSKSSQFLQIGNAVPAPIAYLLSTVNK